MEARSLAVVNPSLNTPEGAIRAIFDGERPHMRGAPKQKLAKPGHVAKTVPTDERNMMREKILKLSLFPNLVNKTMLERSG